MSPAGFRHLHDAEIAQLARLRVVRACSRRLTARASSATWCATSPCGAMVPVADDGTVWLVRQYRV
ncbi:MAG: hypothetical protein R2746_09465 [Acidimicrobiales bacterium]